MRDLDAKSHGDCGCIGCREVRGENLATWDEIDEEIHRALDMSEKNSAIAALGAARSACTQPTHQNSQNDTR